MDDKTDNKEASLASQEAKKLEIKTRKAAEAKALKLRKQRDADKAKQDKIKRRDKKLIKARKMELDALNNKIMKLKAEHGQLEVTIPPEPIHLPLRYLTSDDSDEDSSEDSSDDSDDDSDSDSDKERRRRRRRKRRKAKTKRANTALTSFSFAKKDIIGRAVRRYGFNCNGVQMGSHLSRYGAAIARNDNKRTKQRLSYSFGTTPGQLMGMLLYTTYLLSKTPPLYIGLSYYADKAKEIQQKGNCRELLLIKSEIKKWQIEGITDEMIENLLISPRNWMGLMANKTDDIANIAAIVAYTTAFGTPSQNGAAFRDALNQCALAGWNEKLLLAPKIGYQSPFCYGITYNKVNAIIRNIDDNKITSFQAGIDRRLICGFGRTCWNWRTCTKIHPMGWTIASAKRNAKGKLKGGKYAKRKKKSNTSDDSVEE